MSYLYSLKQLWVPCTLICSGFINLSFAQDIERMYQNTDLDRQHYSSIQLDNKGAMQGILNLALTKGRGRLWKCPLNTYLFYDGWVFVGKKEDGSDIGVVPYNIVGSYIANNEFIKFTFQGLSYENIFELNTRTSQMISYKRTLNQLEKVSCKFLH